MNKLDYIEKYKMYEITDKENFIIDIIYNTNNNFLNKKIYEKPICMLRYNTFLKLNNANKILNKMGYKLKIWDSFRPLKYQEIMWEKFPNELFVANQKKGKCNHCKGSAVDVTLCTLDGEELKMPTEFDHFGIESFRNNYDKLDEETKYNVLLLENTMKQCGFKPFPSEWWHFDDEDEYELIKEVFD